MRRRQFITLLGGAAAAWPLAGLAQEAGKVRRIGFLRVGEPPAAFIDGFRRGLREVGLVEGRDFVIEFALPQGTAQVPGAAAELVRRGVDILLASGTPSVLPARDAAGQIPVVFVATFDPVATGLVASLARPGGNITGMTSISGGAGSTSVLWSPLSHGRSRSPSGDWVAIGCGRNSAGFPIDAPAESATPDKRSPRPRPRGAAGRAALDYVPNDIPAKANEAAASEATKSPPPPRAA